MAAKTTGRKEGSGDGIPLIRDVHLKEELESRFLSYALSTIVSRALPDVRDGLKPVHRRVLYAMNQLRLRPDSRYRKSAAVVGDVIGKYHPHGDQAVYDTMVRLAQDFSLRYPLVDGQGNFGNIDGDSAAAMRYTEAKLSTIAMELLEDLHKDTVDFLPTYDETNEEPRLLPARFPNLLVNGSSGIAVGLATNIPPHNLKETVSALVAMIDNPAMDTGEILKHIKGPDFPTGGQLISTRAEMKEVYETGRGALKVRGEWFREELPKGRWQIVITSIPYGVNKSKLIEKIAEHIMEKRLPNIGDIRDESTEDIRIVLEPKAPTVEADKVISYLYKHSDLQVSFPINLTALTADSTPLRHSLKQMLKSFLDFKLVTTQKRLKYELRLIEERLHILIAYARVYSDLDVAIAIIRKSKVRDEARQGLMARFKLDEVQANAILDLRLSALVGLEISKIKQEKAEKEAEREHITSILSSDSNLWKLAKKELIEIREKYGDPRRTKIVTTVEDEHEYDPEQFIQHEDAHVIISRNGWVRRLKSVASPESLRFKDGDSLLAWMPLNTRDLVCFFTSVGKAYVIRALDLPQTTGFGEPVQSIFKFGDGERLISTFGAIKREGDGAGSAESPATNQRGLFDQLNEGEVGRVYGEILEKETELLLITEGGSGFKFSSETISTETTKNGRKVANVKEDDAVLLVTVAQNKPLLFVLSSDGHGLLMKMEEVPTLTGPGAGVRMMKLKPGATIIGARLVKKGDSVTITYLAGKDDTLKIAGMEEGGRGTVGRKVASPKKKALGLSKLGG
ncbi:MAG: DNA topoisomerase IV subunit A [Nitrospinae bacterium]|nr:DNA topoisomerase IV subunit A [Nitrospinota bacterium]MBF0633544.1 DNA topoisomerase IV subunit A [Nitrospinota bacterium]